MAARWMIYGATGYTGRLALRQALERGERPVAAGRDADAVQALAREAGVEGRAFELGDPGELRRNVGDVVAVLHCAGPFAWTSRAMVDACLATGTHYLDITGEIDVFGSIHARAAEARDGGCVLLPGVGFDVVPTDCLAARLAAELPAAVQLDLAFFAEGGGVSRGTLRTMIERLPAAGAVRRDGELIEVPLAWKSREIEFGCGRRWTMTIPWGDLVTAWHSTGIENIRVFTGASPRRIAQVRRWRWLARVIGLRPLKRALQWWVGRRVSGPDARSRERGRTYLWGEVADAEGRRVEGTFDTPEGYRLTAGAAVDATVRVAAGEVDPGAWTPATAFGAGYVESLPDVSPIVLRRPEDPSVPRR